MTNLNFKYENKNGSIIILDKITGNDKIDDSKLFNIISSKSELPNLINIQIKNQNINLSYNVTNKKLQAMSNLIKGHLYFEQVIPCEHKLSKYDINYFLFLNYLQLDELMVFLSE